MVLLYLSIEHGPLFGKHIWCHLYRASCRMYLFNVLLWKIAMLMNGWWFGCHEFYFPIYIGLLSSSQLTKSYFSEGWPKTTNQEWLSVGSPPSSQGPVVLNPVGWFPLFATGFSSVRLMSRHRVSWNRRWGVPEKIGVYPQIIILNFLGFVLINIYKPTINGGSPMTMEAPICFSWWWGFKPAVWFFWRTGWSM